MAKELWLGKWCLYMMFHKPKHFKLGASIGTTEIDIHLLFVSFGIWK
jgi:hypothetical protein